MAAPGPLLTPHVVQLPQRDVLWLFLQKLFSQCALGVSAALAGSCRQGTVPQGPCTRYSLPCNDFLRCLPCMHHSLTLFWVLLKALSSPETFLTTPFKIISPRPRLPDNALSPFSALIIVIELLPSDIQYNYLLILFYTPPSLECDSAPVPDAAGAQ